MLSKRPSYVTGDDKANEIVVRTLVEPARAKAREAYSAGNFAEAAELYELIAVEYRVAGLEGSAVTFQRRAAEVLARAKGRTGDR